MSHQAVSWAYEQPIQPSGAKFLLVTLANYANPDGFCYPGQEKLGDDTGMSERSVRAHLATLEEAGILRRQFRYDRHGKRTSDGFWLVGFRPLPADIAASLPADSAGSNERLPATSAASKTATTGKKRHDYRQITSSLPADSAGTYKEVDPSVEPSVNHQSIAASPPRVDPLWDVHVELLGFSPTAKTPEHGAWNRACAVYRAIRAGPDDVRLAFRLYTQEFSDMAVTASAVAKHAERLIAKHRNRQNGQGNEQRFRRDATGKVETREEYAARQRRYTG